MLRLKRPLFDMKMSFVASRKFKFNGKTYERYDEFPAKRTTCPSRRLRQIYDRRQIEDVEFLLEAEEASVTMVAPIDLGQNYDKDGSHK